MSNTPLLREHLYRKDPSRTLYPSMLTEQEKGALTMLHANIGGHTLKQTLCEPHWALKTSITIHHNQ
jgi:hypothetical protein